MHHFKEQKEQSTKLNRVRVPDKSYSFPSKPYRATFLRSVLHRHLDVLDLRRRGVSVLRASEPSSLRRPSLQTYLEMHSGFRVRRVVASPRSLESTAK